MSTRSGWPGDASPFHVGEHAVQARAGAREQSERIGRRIIQDFLLDLDRELLAKLPLVLLGSLDDRDRPWGSVLAGAPGFIRALDPRRLRIEGMAALADPSRANLAIDSPVGLLAIDFAARRRVRVNGTVTDVDPSGFSVRVQQSYGNCPQYIQARKPRFVAPVSPLARPAPTEVQGPVLSSGAAAIIAAADTFFICTASSNARVRAPCEGVDISHRGGKPGFVRITEHEGSTVLLAPDFRGNSFFNTLGNLAVNPRTALLFIDFDLGDVLSLTGTAEVLWQGRELEAFLGAERLLCLRVEEGTWMKGVLPLRWSAPEFAPQLAATGSWDDVAAHEPRDGLEVPVVRSSVWTKGG